MAVRWQARSVAGSPDRRIPGPGGAPDLEQSHRLGL